MRKMKLEIEHEKVLLEEKIAKLDKDCFKVEEELRQTKEFYEERIQMISNQLQKAQSENKQLREGQRVFYSNGKQFTLNGSSNMKQLQFFESCDQSSIRMHGNSIDDLKELTLNLKVPKSLLKHTKTNTN